MLRDIFKQMLPFLILMVVLWLMTIFLEKAFVERELPDRLPTPTPLPAAGPGS
jgi:hypothetical protein